MVNAAAGAVGDLLAAPTLDRVGLVVAGDADAFACSGERIGLLVAAESLSAGSQVGPPNRLL
jgi:hypothetical protein